MASAEPNDTNLKYKFNKGDTVWCKWYSRYYRATITKLTVNFDGEQYYGIHYWKFAKRWDMSVSEKKLLPWTKESGKFVHNRHRELSRIKKEKKLKAELIADIQRNNENSLCQVPFISLSKVDSLLKGYVPSEHHHSAGENVHLTFLIHKDYFELKNLPTKSSASNNGLHQVEMIEPLVLDKDSEMPKTGLLKAFSSKEKDVINVLDNMRTKTMRLRNRSSQKTDQEGSDILNIKKLSMPPQTTNCIITIVSNPEINVNDGRHTLDVENDNSTKDVTIPKPEEHSMCLDYSTDCSVSNKSKTCCKVNNILSILNDGPCHISSVSVITSTMPQQHENNLKDTENTNFDINGEDKKNDTPNISIKVENLTELENILISEKSNLSNTTKKESISLEISNLLTPTTAPNRKRKLNYLNDKTTDGNYTNGNNAKRCSLTPDSTLNKKNQIDNNESIITEDFISNNLSINEPEESVVSPLLFSTPTSADTNIIHFECETTNDFITNDVSLNEPIDSAITPLTVPSTTMQTNNGYDCESIGVSTQTSHHTSNENWSCGSVSSSTSISILHNPAESDDDIDGQTTDEDDQYVKNRKVSKKKLKQFDNVDPRTYAFFDCDMSYLTRAAKVKASEAISQMSKTTPLNKEKKTDVGKRSKNGKKKEDECPQIFQSAFAAYNLDVPMCVTRNSIIDKQFVVDDRLIPIVPSQLSVYQIICDYSTKFQRCLDTMNVLLSIFDQVLSIWLLHPLEILKYNEMLEKYPDRRLCQIYGRSYLLRFIIKLPKLFNLIKTNFSEDYLSRFLYFVQGLFIYLEDEDYQISIADYDCVMPDYYRMAYS